MRIHKETIASELQLLIDGMNTKEQAVEEIAAYIRWRDKQLTIPDVVFNEGAAEVECEHDYTDGAGTGWYVCKKCGDMY